jgi:hypothetical protein
MAGGDHDDRRLIGAGLGAVVGAGIKFLALR